MKELRGQESGGRKLNLLVAGFAAALFLGGCTEEREAALPDGAGDHLYEKSFLSGLKGTLSTSGTLITSNSNSLKANSETKKTEVKKVSLHEAVKHVFADMEISGEPNQVYEIVTSIDKDFLTFHRMIPNTESLSVQERQLTENGMLPMIKFPVSAYGTLVRQKNDLDEETDTLRLKGTTWEEASHVEVQLVKSERKVVSVPAGHQDLLDEIFVKEKINQSIFTRSQMADLMGLQLESPPGSQFYTEIVGAILNLYEIKRYSELDDALREVIDAQDKGQSKRADVSRCSAAILEALGGGMEDCIAIHKYEVPITHVKASLAVVDHAGSKSADIEYRELPSTSADSELIEIVKNVQFRTINPSNQIGNLDPSKVLKIADVSGEEFLFRRTLQDSPNGFDFTFTGASGKLELVKFVFERERVRVVRANPLLPTGGGTSVDVETLLSLPASYVKEVYVDLNGNPISSPRIEDSNHSDPEAIALIEWAANSIPNVSSPLNYYGLEQCFSGASERVVAAVDQRMGEGMLNFSLKTTYASSTRLDCAGIGRAGYFDKVQANFTFKERLSFKKHDSSREEPLLDVPYLAQKLLGFGLFTYKKHKPNEFGNTGLDGTEVPLPAIFDLREDRKVQYILAGIPESGELRSRIIQATQEVVTDLNSAFSQALTDTPNSRSGNVIELLVEGDDVPKVEVGDLDQNLIYYVQKKTASPVIGLGGAHSNPKSGAVEAASVFMYGGNLLAFVERMKKVTQAEKEYAEKTQLQISNDLPPLEDGANHDGDATASNSEDVAVINHAKEGNDFTQMTHDFHEHVHANQGSMTGYAELLDQLAIDQDAAKHDAISDLREETSMVSIFSALHAAMKEGDIRNSGLLETMVNEELIDALAGQVSTDELNELRGQANQQRAISKAMKNLRDANICLFEASEAARVASSQVGASDMDLLVAMYKATLAHELGHNMGLRHNFLGSFDASNFKHHAADSSFRDYSSIMDYLANDHHSYDGFGPQDVAALRAAYGGVLELHAGVLPAVKKDASGKSYLPLSADGKERVYLHGSKYISIEDYKSVIGLDSWMDLSASDLSKLPIKRYAFCSDEDVGYTPICARFDQGTSPSAIVQNHVKNYRAHYSLRNFPNDKLKFGWSDFGSYIGGLFRRFISVRQFLEETIYLAISGASGDTINAYAQAAIDGMRFFHEVIRVPDAASVFEGDERFVPVELMPGISVVAEKKWTSNLSSSLDSSRLKVRGVEFDKVIALIALTERRFGFTRYERVSLRFSYPEFEQLIMDSESKLETPTLGLLTEILSNNVEPAAATPLGLLKLDGRFKVNTTEMIRFYAVLGSILNLDVQGLETTDNTAMLFRVLSDFHAPWGVEYVTQPGTANSDTTALKYWTHESAEASHSLINKLKGMSVLDSKKETLTSMFKTWIVSELAESAEAEAEAEQADSGEVEEDSLEDQIDGIISKMPESLGARSMAEVGPAVKQVIELSQTLEMLQPIFPARVFAQIISDVRTDIENLAKKNLVTAVALAAVPAEDLKLKVFEQVVPSRVLDLQQGIMFRNVQSMNQIFSLLHPEYQK